ncbi:DUF4226 domain-containing protein [Mycolicibacter heraklionensis]|nr:DUF4226 domain-containing protein [Mycolicibacter heraklionensis]
MTTRDDVLDAIGRIERAGGAGEATRLAQAALTLPLPPSGYDSVLTRLRSVYPVPGDQQQGRAAQAMKLAETALAQQLSSAAGFDRQIIEALRHAHKTTLEGRRRLDELEAEIAGAAGAWDLDTAAGAREFQRFLIGKLGQIIKVVEETNDDDTSKQALANALTGLYAAAQSDRRDPPPAEEGQPSLGPDPDSYPDVLVDDEPAADAADDTEVPQGLPQLATPMFPGLGADGPGFGAMPAAMPAGLPWTGLTPGAGGDDLPAEDDYRPEEAATADAPDGADADGADGDTPAQEPGEQGLVTVRLPDGETTTVANPQLGAAMQAVADGQPVVEAFRSQGIHVPPPGTPVVAAVDVTSLRPGDIGVFTDRHALAVGGGKALLDGQLHLVENLRGPGFLGWQHPPALAQEPAPASAQEPAPVATRPAAALGSLMSLKKPAPTGIVD